MRRRLKVVIWISGVILVHGLAVSLIDYWYDKPSHGIPRISSEENGESSNKKRLVATVSTQERRYGPIHYNASFIENATFTEHFTDKEEHIHVRTYEGAPSTNRGQRVKSMKNSGQLVKVINRSDLAAESDVYASSKLNSSNESSAKGLGSNISKTETRHIAFLKVHKAASSTMQNIFYRFGMKRNLTFVMTTHTNYFSRVQNKHFPLVPPSKREAGYDILCNHGIFNYSLYSQVLPNDTVYLATVRKPLSLFVSAFTFFRDQLDYIKNAENITLKSLIHNPDTFEPRRLTLTRNSMARDFGLLAWKPGDVRIDRSLRTLNKIFKLVLIVEYFDESIILMRRLLGWSLHDVVYISKKVLRNDTGLRSLATHDIDVFKKRNHIDYRIYDSFNKTFWEKMATQSPDIYEEISYFKRLVAHVESFCRHGSDVALTVPKSVWNDVFSITMAECRYMKMKELRLTKILRELQGSTIGKTSHPVT